MKMNNKDVSLETVAPKMFHAIMSIVVKKDR